MLEGHMGTLALRSVGNSRVLQHSGHLGIWGIRALEGHLCTRALKAREHLDTQALGHPVNQRAHGHSGISALEPLEALYFVDSFFKFF